MRAISYTEARDHLASIWDQAVATREPVFIDRRGHESMVMVPTGEWEGLVETAHMFRSPANARRLLASLQRLEQGEGLEMTVEDLAAQTGVA